MKIFCDYCGTQFETEENNTCPSCGGAYEGDDEIKNAAIKQAREDELKRQQELTALKARQAQIDNMNTQNKNKSAVTKFILIGCGAPIALIVIFWLIVFIIAAVEVGNERLGGEEQENESASLLEDYEYQSVFDDEEYEYTENSAAYIENIIKGD